MISNKFGLNLETVFSYISSKSCSIEYRYAECFGAYMTALPDIFCDSPDNYYCKLARHSGKPLVGSWDTCWKLSRTTVKTSITAKCEISKYNKMEDN